MKIPAIVFLVLANVGLFSSYSQAPNTLTQGAIKLAKADIEALSTQLKLYQAMNGFLPATEQGIKALVDCPATDPKPPQWHQLLSKVPRDPWGRPYLYKTPGVHNPNSFDVYSAGPDGKADTDDDIGNW